MQLAGDAETKACDLSAAPAGLKIAEQLFEPMICCIARATDANVDLRDVALANTTKQVQFSLAESKSETSV